MYPVDDLIIKFLEITITSALSGPTQIPLKALFNLSALSSVKEKGAFCLKLYRS